MEVEVGKSYKARNGTKETIVEHYAYYPDFPFRSDSGRWYSDKGMWISFKNTPHDLVSKWVDNQPDAAPKTFGEMTDAEKGALYVAKHYYGKDIQRLFYGNTPAEYWRDTDFDDPQDEQVYRIKPEPKKGTVKLCGYFEGGGWDFHDGYPDDHTTHTLTIPTKDGKPIPGAYRSDAGDELIVGEV